MKNGRLKNTITSLFLVLFLSMKMAGLHVLYHTDDKDDVPHCTVCDHAIVNNLIPLLSPDLPNFTIENTEFITSRGENSIDYNCIILGKIVSGQLFSRPPPFLL